MSSVDLSRINSPCYLIQISSADVARGVQRQQIVEEEKNEQIRGENDGVDLSAHANNGSISIVVEQEESLRSAEVSDSKKQSSSGSSSFCSDVRLQR
jgi:hypothetical protein